MNKNLVISLVVLVALGAAAYFFYSPSPAGTPAPSDSAAKEYVGPADISFSYPNNYTLTQRQDSYEGNPIQVITLVDSGVTVPDMSDGPPAISIIEVPNPANLPLGEWVTEKSISNFHLSPDQTLASTSVAGEAAVAYRHSGLYESQAFAVAHAGKIFILSVGSIDPSEAIHRDFENLLSTVQFK
jgi:hypothetical protein